MKKLGLLVVALVSAGCVSTLPPPTDVRLTSTVSDVATCQMIGPVRGDHNLYGGAMYKLAEDAARAQIMNKAANMGGNVVLLSYSTVGWAGANMAGTAYRC